MPNPAVTTTTDLAESVFFRPKKDENGFEPCRQSISALLLASIQEDKTKVMGLLHPDPAKPLDISMLSHIPFLRAANWPFESGEIITEWVIKSPKGFEVLHTFPIGNL